MSNIEIISTEDIENSLIFATMYLVIDRVSQLLESITYETFMEIKNKYKDVPKKAKFYIDFKFDDENFLMMTPYPQSNMSCDKYPNEHSYINNLLKNKELQH